MRCRWLVPLLAILAFPSGVAAQPSDTPAPIVFTVQRDGTPIGTHRLSFSRDGDNLVVDIEIRLEVRLAFITLFRYAHNARETWRSGRLVAFASRTDDDGAAFEVHARATPDGLLVEGSGGNYLAPVDTMPSSYWNAEMVTRPRVLDSQSGRMIDLVATPVGLRSEVIAGREMPLRVYRLSGEIAGELAYGPEDEWLVLRFGTRGSDIAYIRATSAAVLR